MPPACSPVMIARFALQRSQTVGKAASWPTWVEKFQQRSHFTPSALPTSKAISDFGRALLQLHLRDNE